jgi:hypothetical protein
MKRIATVGALVGALVLAAVVAAQGPGRGPRQRDTDPPPPGGGGPGGPPREPGMNPELSRLESEYADQVRQAHKEIAEQRRKLDENMESVRTLLGRMRGATAEERQQLRPEIERLVRETTDLEVQIAQRQLDVAQQGLTLAIERLVEAKVALREAQIKKARRDAWLRGDWGRRMREHGPDRDRERTERGADQEETQEQKPGDVPQDDQPDGPEE